MQILFCTVIFGGGIVPPRQDPNKPVWVKGEILVKFKDDVKLQIDNSKGIIETGLISLDKLTQKWQVTDIEKVFKNEEKRTETKTIMTYTGEIIEVPQLFNIYKLKFSEKTDVKEVIADFEKNPNVNYAEPNYIAKICDIPDDPDFSNQWGLHNTGQYHLTDADIDAPEAWDIETGDSTVIIGILDTGVDYGHPDLTDNVISTGYDFVNNDDDAMDDNGHGSHVAGIAAAKTNNTTGIAGVAWNCKILPVKVMQSNGYGSYSDIASGVNYAANNGAKVINLSLGGYASSYVLQNALENAYTTSVIVGAAGNGGTSVPFYPAAWSFVIGVGASDVLYNQITQTWYETKAVFSNYGINADIYAPGVNIYSTIPLFHPHTYSYASWNGTSMAAPFVTGTVALLRSHYSDWSNELIHGQLIYSSDGIDGGIRLNAHRALIEVPEPQLNLYSHTIIDTLAGCDQDGIPDAGETVEMVFDIQNTWGQAYNVEAKLSYHSYEDTCFVTIIDSIATFGGGVSPYAHVNNETNPFMFFVKNNTPNNTDVYFDYEITCDGYSFTGTFYTTTQRGIEIGGIISESTTWSNDYLYIVTGNILVEAGDTLIIEPGTRIQFNSDKYLRINGCFIAKGTEDSMIVFTSNSNNPSSRDWCGIYLIGCIDAVFDDNGNYISGSIMKYAEIEFAGEETTYPYDGPLCIDGCSPYIAYNLIHDNYRGITFVNNVESRVEYNIIQNNSSFGVYTGYSGCQQLNISHNLIEDNEMGMSVGSSPTITHNIIRGHQSSGLFITSDATIYYNTLYNNGGLEIGHSTNYCSYGGIIRNNTIIYNCTGLVLGSINNYSYAIIDSNNLIGNPGQQYAIYMQQGVGINTFHNYWGTTNTLSIDAWIWDYLDDFCLGLVNYQPFDSLPVATAPGFLYQVEFNPPPPIGCEVDTFNLIFSKPMDISIQPYVTFGVCEPYTQHIIEGAWVDSTNWQGTYTFGIMTGDGINHLRVTTAQDCEGMEIPKDTRFSFIIDATGASSVGFIAQAGIGKVDLEWNGQDMVDLMGYNMYRYYKVTDSTYSDTTLVNTSMITDTTYCDMSVIPDTTYYYMYTGISTDFIESGYSDPASATPFDAAPGDANGDMSVDVLDITTIVAYMLNQNPQPFLFDAADVNGDDVINVLDIIGVVGIINGTKSAPLSKLISLSNEAAWISVTEDGINLDSKGNLAALQFEIKGITHENLTMISNLYGFEFAHVVEKDKIIGILFSFTGKLIPEGTIEIINFNKSAPDLVFSEVIGGDLKGQYVPVHFKGGTIPNGSNELKAFSSPNPFSGTTHIQYELDEFSEVSIRIYDLSGILVKVFQMPVQPKGQYSIVWQGDNESGIALKNGIYFCRIQARSILSGSNRQANMKLVLIR